jgi:hypothetical protein
MSDAEIDINMPEQANDVPLRDNDIPMPNIQPEDPLPRTRGVDNDPDDVDDDPEDTKVGMRIKEIVPDAEVFKDATDQAPPKRKKREISEKQKAHLAKIRVKALEAKKAKANEKKANNVPVKSAKKVYEQQIEDDYSDTESAEYDIDPPVVDKGSMLVSLTPQQLRQLQIEAIYGYDTIRKDRKAKKKEQQAKEQQEQRAYQAVSRAVNRPIDDDGWGVCFQ